MEITRIRHAWPEARGLYIDRPNGYGEYTILHFWNIMNVSCDEGIVLTKPNAFIIYDENTMQKFFSYDYDVVHDWLHVKGDLGALLRRYGLKTNHIYYPENGSFITDIVREMESELFLKKKFVESLLELKLNELIVKVAQSIEHGSEGIRVDGRTRKRLNQVRQEVFLSLESSISVASMAEMANLSESRFYVIYKAIYGVSPAKDLILARIQRAKFLLAQNEYSISEVAKMAGYSSEYHFIRQFKQQTGITPGKYRL